MSIILILSKMRQFFFSKTNESWDILYNKNNKALRTLMAYINFLVFCLCWHALFIESSVYYVLPSFHYLMLLLFALRRFTLIAVSFFFFRFQKHSFHEMHKLIEKKTCNTCMSQCTCFLVHFIQPSFHLFVLIHFFKHIFSHVI